MHASSPDSDRAANATLNRTRLYPEVETALTDVPPEVSRSETLPP